MEKQQPNKAETRRGSLEHPFPCSSSEVRLEMEEEKVAVAERVWRLTLGYSGAMPAPWPRCTGSPFAAAPCACVPAWVEGSCPRPSVSTWLSYSRSVLIYVCVYLYTRVHTGLGGSLLCHRAAEVQPDCQTPRDDREVGSH